MEKEALQLFSFQPNPCVALFIHPGTMKINCRSQRKRNESLLLLADVCTQQGQHFSSLAARRTTKGVTRGKNTWTATNPQWNGVAFSFFLLLLSRGRKVVAKLLLSVCFVRNQSVVAECRVLLCLHLYCGQTINSAGGRGIISTLNCWVCVPVRIYL